ncbi:MAG: hypothetical protein ABID09_03205 [Candidatus Omnitrophota bacterium]
MKRIILGMGWLSIINITTNFIGGFIRGAIVGFKGNPTSGAQAGASFTQEYGGIVFFAAAVIAIIGTATGILPYTKKESPAPKRSEP